MPKTPDDELRMHADGFYRFMAEHSKHVPPESMIVACEMMIAAVVVATEPVPPVLVTVDPQPSPAFARGHQIGNEIAGMIEHIRAGRKPANDGRG